MLTKDVLFGVNILSLAGLLLYALIAISAHFLMSLGQTLFHLYLGHRRFGGRFFRNHMQFHHVHYSGNHVVSAHYLDNGDNNTLFFLTPVALVVGLGYCFLRLDFFMVQLAAMSLSFYGHVYIDKQFHVAESWLGRFSWFRRKQQLHFVHHRHANCNFAVIDNFWDQLLGTYRSDEAIRQRLIALSQARPYVAAPPRSKPDFGPWFGRWPSRLGAFPSLFFDAVGRA